MDKNLKEILKNVKDAASVDSSTSPYDTTATVTRLDGSTVWVHIPGGVAETPAAKSISCAVGDTVRVRVSGGKAWLTGNDSAPPTDDTAAKDAKKTAAAAGMAADVAKEHATVAQSTADDAKTTAEAAQEKADAAQSAADSAANAASTAQSKADEATRAASAAQSSAATAAQAAATAQSTADAAKASASSATNAASAAQTKANEAATAAATAQSKADSAGTAASKAQSSANAAGEAASSAQAAAEAAQSAADNAQTDIDSQKEYFWHDANGAHVLGSKTAATRYRTDIDSEGMHIKDVSGKIQEIAKFTASGAQIGKGSNAESVFWVDNDGIDLMRKGDNDYVYFHVGYSDNAIGENGNVLAAPYYTVGNRREKEGIGAYSYAEGQNVISSRYASHAEGQNTKASAYCAHAEGGGTTASGGSAHAEGYGTTASGIRAHAEGDNAVASGYGAHAEGDSTTASGFCAHAEGKGTVANGYASHAQNMSTIAGFEYQTVLGRYNANAEGNAVEVGNGGGENSRSNAVTIDWNGNVTASGDIVPGKITGIANLIYPVGSIYMSVNSTSPATLFGGTWERIQDRFLLAASPAYRAGGMGGEATHTLTVNEMPSHEHRDMMFGDNTGNYFGVNQGAQVNPGFESKWNVNYTTGTGQAYFYTARAGNSAAHNNMPPYLTVYMWKRTA